MKTTTRSGKDGNQPFTCRHYFEIFLSFILTVFTFSFRTVHFLSNPNLREELQIISLLPFSSLCRSLRGV